MQVSVEKTGELERRMTVQVPSADIDSQVSARLGQLRKEVRLKGFRPGKVPMNVVQQRYGKQVREEVMGEVMQTSLQKAIEEQSLRVAGVTKIEPAGNSEEGFEFHATVEVFPEIPQLDVTGLAVEKPDAAIAAEDVDDMIETLREQQRVWAPAERPAEEGDRVRFAYVADLDGQRIPDTGQHELAPILGKIDNFPTLAEALSGASQGDQKSVSLSFPENYRHADLAGKTAEVELTIKLVETSSLPEVDDEFAKSFGIDGGVEKLRADVEKNLNRELKAALQNRTKQAVIEALLEKFGDIQLPNSSVLQEARQMQAQLHQQNQGQGTPPPLEAFKSTAERRLRLGLLFGELARQNELKIDEARVQSKLEEVADTYENPAQIIEIYRADERLMDQLENIVLEEQVVDAILDRAEVTSKTVSFKELMEQS